MNNNFYNRRKKQITQLQIHPTVQEIYLDLDEEFCGIFSDEEIMKAASNAYILLEADYDKISYMDRDSLFVGLPSLTDSDIENRQWGISVDKCKYYPSYLKENWKYH